MRSPPLVSFFKRAASEIVFTICGGSSAAVDDSDSFHFARAFESLSNVEILEKFIPPPLFVRARGFKLIKILKYGSMMIFLFRYNFFNKSL